MYIIYYLNNYLLYIYRYINARCEISIQNRTSITLSRLSIMHFDPTGYLDCSNARPNVNLYY